MTSPVFLPWVRRGIGRGLGEIDDRTGALSARAAVDAELTVVDDLGAQAPVARAMAVLGPADVTGIEATQVVRLEPPAGATEVDANQLAHIELLAPDLPWILTPARADGDGALRPWLALVCVEEGREGVSFDSAAAPCPVLRLSRDAAARELPDLAESWAWAHVQSLVPVVDVAGEVDGGTGAVTARLLSPRRLRPGRTYRAALVPAFDLGRLAGTGAEIDPEADEIRPAWDLTGLPDTLDLPVYVTWTFTTSSVPGDFEDMCRRLEPDTAGGPLGYRASRVVDDGLLEEFTGPTGFDYEGSLVDPDSSGTPLPTDAKAWFQDGMAEAVERSAARLTVPATPGRGYRPERDDPVVGPPMYGSWAADTTELPASGWLHAVNVRADRRTPAGLGAEIVRAHQAELLAAAWDQAGDVRALRDELNRSRLAAEVGRSQARRLASLDDGALLQATARLHTFVVMASLSGPSGPGDGPIVIEPQAGGPTTSPPLTVTRATAVETIVGSVAMPSALVSASFQRQVRPGGSIGRRFAAASKPAPLATTTAAFVAASAPADERPASGEQCAQFGAGFVPHGTITGSTQFRHPVTQLPDFESPHQVPRADRIAATGPIIDTQEDSTVFVIDETLVPLVTAAKDDLRQVAAAVRDQLDPMPTTVRQLASRISGVTLDLSADLPTRVVVGARFAQPLAPWLIDLGAELLVPGIGEVANNRVRMLAVNEGAVAALLVGATHEWAREALYHEYPADLGATAFDRFWSSVDPARTDLDADIHTWTEGSSLESHVGGEGSSTVLLVRGDVIRRYPDCQFLLVEPAADGGVLEDGELPEDRVTRPMFAVTLDASTVAVGFDVDPNLVLNDDWYLGLEEPISGPWFGLDVAQPDHHGSVPLEWDDLSWGHVTASPEELETAEQLVLASPTWLEGASPGGTTWARNSAHVASSLFQRPFRLLFPADHLVPPSAARRR